MCFLEGPILWCCHGVSRKYWREIGLVPKNRIFLASHRSGAYVEWPIWTTTHRKRSTQGAVETLKLPFSVFGTTDLCVAHCTLLRSKSHPHASSKSCSFYMKWHSRCPAAYLWCCHHCHRWDLHRQTCIHDNTKYWKLKVRVNLFALNVFPTSDSWTVTLCWKVLEGPWARLRSLNSLWVVCATQPSCVVVRIDAHAY